MDSFSFCLSRKLYFSFNFHWKFWWVEYSLLACFFFLSFQTLSMSCYRLLAFKACAEKSADSVILVPSYVTFFKKKFCFFKILSFSLTFDSWIIMCLDVGLLTFILLGLLSIPAPQVYFFPRLKKFRAIIFLDKFSSRLLSLLFLSGLL